MNKQKYLDKEKMIKAGFIRLPSGILYKKNVLEKYYDLGYLNLPNSKFSAEDRMRAGQKLAFDYYMGTKDSLHSVNYFQLKTKGEIKNESERSLYYKERYLQAVQSIPSEFWGAVRQVCIEDKEIKGDSNLNRKSLINRHYVYHMKALLNMGLERLVKFYLQKK